MLKCIQLDGIFHALSDPTRRFILEVVCDGEASASELAEPFALDLTTILDEWVVQRRKAWDPRLRRL